MSLPAQQERRRRLRGAKAGATGLLVVAAAVLVVARLADPAGSGVWGYVQAGAEAALVGGLADWFAVTALFRHPLGLPIPHTALIPTRKDALGATLGEFVADNFLSEPVVRTRLAALGIADRLADLLANPRQAARLAAELAAAARGMLSVARDEDVHGLLDELVVQRLAAVNWGPPLGALLHQAVTDGAHTGVVDLVADRTVVWAEANRDRVVSVVAAQAPGWTPRFVDDAVAGRVHAELVRFAADVRDTPDHPLRATVDNALLKLAEDLRSDAATQDRLAAVVTRLAEHPGLREALARVWDSVRAQLLAAADDPDGPLRARLTGGIVATGERLQAEPELRAKVDVWVADAAVHLVTGYSAEIAGTISDTISRWDPEETTEKVELAVGRDLQFIRVNGTVVGALAGLAIHAVTTLLH